MTPTMVADCDRTRLMMKRGMFDKREQKIYGDDDDDDDNWQKI